jgi:putative transposase
METPSDPGAVHPAVGPHRFLFLYLDAACCDVRVNHQIVSQAIVIASGITADSGCEVDGRRQRDRGISEQVPRSLGERGLSEVRLVIADHHSGMMRALRKAMLVAVQQRCVFTSCKMNFP